MVRELLSGTKREIDSDSVSNFDVGTASSSPSSAVSLLCYYIVFYQISAYPLQINSKSEYRNQLDGINFFFVVHRIESFKIFH